MANLNLLIHSRLTLQSIVFLAQPLMQRLTFMSIQLQLRLENEQEQVNNGSDPDKWQTGASQPAPPHLLQCIQLEWTRPHNELRHRRWPIPPDVIRQKSESGEMHYGEAR